MLATKFTNGAVTHEVSTLLRHAAQLRLENKALRDRLPSSADRSARVRMAAQDAHAILMEAFVSGCSSRDHMRKIAGMSVRRWQWGVAVLRYCGIVSRDAAKWQAGLVWLIAERARAVELWEKACEELAVPAGYRRLRGLLRS